MRTPLILLLVVALGAGCRSAPAPLAALALRADSSSRTSIAPGVTSYAFTIRSGPWEVRVLDVDRRACWSLQAIKAGNTAVGRATVPRLAEAADSAARRQGERVVGGVNADFFSFTPPGVPTGAMIHAGRVITGPVRRPVFAVDSAGRPWIGVLRVLGVALLGSDTVRLEGWNRKVPGALSWFDAGYGGVPDTAGLALLVPAGPGLLALGAGADSVEMHRLDTLPPSRLSARVVLDPFHPLEAVGGFPILVRDSIEADTLDRTGSLTFAPVRHPRTMVGLAAGGRRVLLVTVDGRQEGFSAGMTLRESAQLMRDLGATEALNLDGGGSTTLVVRSAAENESGFRIANRPSDAAGPRPVANALMVVSGCRGR